MPHMKYQSSGTYSSQDDDFLSYLLIYIYLHSWITSTGPNYLKHFWQFYACI